MSSAMFEYNKHRTRSPRSIVESKKNSRTWSHMTVRSNRFMICDVPNIRPKEPSTSLQTRGKDQLLLLSLSACAEDASIAH